MDKARGNKSQRSRLKPKPEVTSFFCPDPVVEQSLREDLSLNKSKTKKKKAEDDTLKPDLNKRVELTTHDTSIPPGAKYVAPKTKKEKMMYVERRRKYVEDLNFCQYKEAAVPSPAPGKPTKLDIRFQQPSLEIKEAKVFPRKPSTTASDLYPDPPNVKDLTTREPRSGTIINVQKSKERKKRRRKQPSEESPAPTIEDLINQELSTIQEMAENNADYGGEDSPPLDNYLSKQFRKKVSQLSKSTSIQSKNIKPTEEEEGADEEPEDKLISTLVQKFRRDSEIRRFQKPRRKTKSGTFENFSFTRLKQPTLKTFFYGVKLGTVHQCDRHFSALSRGRQGICMPIAAYCFSILKHPDKWSTADIDNVLEAGNDLFLESVDTRHLHGDDVNLKITDLRKYCKLGRKKVRFVVSEPEISGMVRSGDRKVYNLTKALNIFFGKYTAGILQTEVLSVAIWKDKHFYFFDAGPRTIDLFTHPNGTGLMANFYDTTSVVTVLLNRSNLENLPFIMYSIQAFKVLSRDAEEVDSTGVVPENDNFQVLSEEKAVAVGSFDLADKCFGFSRNKQAIAIAAVALVYSKITPPSSWHKGTVDKIIIIGNQLFLECIENDTVEQVRIDDLPAVFTIGPYVVEIYVVANCYVDFMFKKSKCVLHERLEKFFETNSNAIVEIDYSTIAVWKQRNVYHCLDPYSRNREGTKCRDGAACVSMHTTLESLTAMISTNFDHKDMIFHIHAMKVCKVHRDPGSKELFPKCLTMNEYPVENFKKIKMKKSRRKATVKSVTVDHDTRATFYGDVPEGSITEVGSTVRSIGLEDLPPMCHRVPSRHLPKIAPPDEEFVADLDSPSLSDTQIEPPLPEQPEGESVIDFMDLDSFQLTQEEKEMHKRGEAAETGEGKADKKKISGEDAGEGEEGEGSDNWYMAATDFTQIGSHSLMSKQSQEVNTEAFNVEIPDEEVPTIARNVTEIARRKRQEFAGVDDVEVTQEPDVTLSEEIAKETNFMDLPDGSQIILGGTNIAAFGSDLELMAPFVCIMAAAVAKKYSIDSWSKEVVDYVLKCGSELHQTSNTRYDQNYKLEIPRISLGRTDFSIRVNYIFDAHIKHRVLAMSITNMLFSQWTTGIVVTPTYSCALFFKNHLYYLYDGFANNEVGLGKGTSNEGVACLARFQDVNLLVTRILHNKAKREEEENVEYNRFVLSSCYVKQLPREDIAEEKEVIQEEDEEGDQEGGDQDVHVQSFKKTKEIKEEPPPKMGYHVVDGIHKIQGSKSVGGAETISDDLKEDYFVCLCACLHILNTPIKNWDDRRVDTVIDQGIQMFNKVEDVAVCSKKIIKNILVDEYLFDIKAKRMTFMSYKSRRTLRAGIETMLLKKHEHFILQFPNRSYALSVDGDTYHLFDPSDQERASWTKFTNFRRLVQRLKSGLVSGGESYNFHSFEVTSILKAPKSVIISNRAKKYKMLKGKKEEVMGKPFYEEVSWLEIDPIPWSWRVNKGDLPTWNNWFMDFPDDLYSLFGSLSPMDDRFPAETRKKQTLGNLVVAIGMLQIYDLVDWSSIIMDSILINGDVFFQNCIKDIGDENYELAFEDINKECVIFPYSFQIRLTPIIEGTIFLVRLKQFNLFKALRLFFDDYDKRFGIVCVTKGENDKRLYAFGKTHDSEYFLYDCETLGPPMYVEKDSGVPYILRTTTLNRLLHVMTLTLRGGDFYIFEVGLSELKSVT